MTDKFEYLIAEHRERANIRDMLGPLTNESIITKVSETPQKIKYNLKRIKTKLSKLGVTLNEKNEVVV
jgi:hypothetical protein